jgi:hypothetical protein
MVRLQIDASNLIPIKTLKSNKTHIPKSQSAFLPECTNVDNNKNKIKIKQTV